MGMAPARRTISHPFYVSVTEINYNGAEKTLEISCKLFTDDFEKALAKASGQPIDLYRPVDKELLDKQIWAYFRKHFSMRVDGRVLPAEYVGHELEEQSTFVYFQLNEAGSAPKKLEINNSVLYEFNEKQMGIIHASINNNRKSTRIENPVSDAVLTW
jgi:hypothetical protein